MIGFLIQIGRNIRIGYALAREGALALIEPSLLPPAPRALIRTARLIERRGAEQDQERLSKAFARLGPSFVKAGQFLATRPDIIGFKAAKGLESLQDKMQPFPQDQAEAMLSVALGKPWEQVFASLSQPIAAASIAQVHQGILQEGGQEGRMVAVKILRPDIRARFSRDLKGMRFVARMAERFSAEARRLRMEDVVELIARSVSAEMDLRLEAAALSELREAIEHDPLMSAPKPLWDLTSRDVMVSEWVEGIPLNDLSAIDRAGHDRAALAKNLLQGFLKQAIHHGFFHADMHQGNLFVDTSSRLVMVDCGIMGRLGLKERRFLAEILYGFITRNYKRIAEVHFEAGYVPAHHSVEDFAQALRAVGEPIHDRRASDISMAKLLGLLFEITALFDMQSRTELVMLQKTMVVVEGVARTLNPGFDMWRIAEPIVRSWLERQLGPRGMIEEATRSLNAVMDSALLLPELVKKLSDKPVKVKPNPPLYPLALVLGLWAIATGLAVLVFQNW
jgi:ubiquinone biosynthesis protein